MAEESVGTRAAYGIAGSGGIPGCAHFVPIADDEKDQAPLAPVDEPTVPEVASRERQA